MPRTHKQIVGFPKLGPREPREIERLKKMPDSEIDYSDIPPAKPGGWVRGVDFLRAINPPLTLQLDPDVAAWTGVDYNNFLIDGVPVPVLFGGSRAKLALPVRKS